LLRPIPDQTASLGRKSTYRDYSLLKTVAISREPLVDIGNYGIAGQPYYSRHNPVTGDPLPEVASAVYVRQGLAERLADINLALQQSTEITKLMNGQVELYIEEGWRARQTQAFLYREVFPRLIHKQQPAMSKAEVMARRDQLIAAPAKEGLSPSPHTTGAAVDITLRYADPEPGYRPKKMVTMSNDTGTTGDTMQLDYYEHQGKLMARDRLAQRNRRIFYWVMRGALLPSGESGLVCNPTEWWHWSYGDQLWGILTQAPYAFYDSVDII
jgi:D-alanyl-D-alanine dipeptidase